MTDTQRYLGEFSSPTANELAVWSQWTPTKHFLVNADAWNRWVSLTWGGFKEETGSRCNKNLEKRRLFYKIGGHVGAHFFVFKNREKAREREREIKGERIREKDQQIKHQQQCVGLSVAPEVTHYERVHLRTPQTTDKTSACACVCVRVWVRYVGPVFLTNRVSDVCDPPVGCGVRRFFFFGQILNVSAFASRR